MGIDVGTTLRLGSRPLEMAKALRAETSAERAPMSELYGTLARRMDDELVAAHEQVRDLRTEIEALPERPEGSIPHGTPVVDTLMAPADAVDKLTDIAPELELHRIALQQRLQQPMHIEAARFLGQPVVELVPSPKSGAESYRIAAHTQLGKAEGYSNYEEAMSVTRAAVTSSSEHPEIKSGFVITAEEADGSRKYLALGSRDAIEPTKWKKKFRREKAELPQVRKHDAAVYGVFTTNGTRRYPSGVSGESPVPPPSALESIRTNVVDDAKARLEQIAETEKTVEQIHERRQEVTRALRRSRVIEETVPSKKGSEPIEWEGIDLAAAREGSNTQPLIATRPAGAPLVVEKVDGQLEEAIDRALELSQEGMTAVTQAADGAFHVTGLATVDGRSLWPGVKFGKLEPDSLHKDVRALVDSRAGVALVNGKHGLVQLDGPNFDANPTLLERWSNERALNNTTDYYGYSRGDAVSFKRLPGESELFMPIAQTAEKALEAARGMSKAHDDVSIGVMQGAEDQFYLAGLAFSGSGSGRSAHSALKYIVQGSSTTSY